jgi:hypothetical protein
MKMALTKVALLPSLQLAYISSSSTRMQELAKSLTRANDPQNE